MRTPFKKWHRLPNAQNPKRSGDATRHVTNRRHCRSHWLCGLKTLASRYRPIICTQDVDFDLSILKLLIGTLFATFGRKVVSI